MRGALSSPSLRLIGKRLLAAIPVLWGVTLVTFLVINVMPGNAASQLLGANATPCTPSGSARRMDMFCSGWASHSFTV